MVDIEGVLKMDGSVKGEVTVLPGLRYTTALNKKNAIRKFKKLAS